MQADHELERQRVLSMASALRTLTQYPEWEVFRKAMAQAEEDKVEHLITCPRVDHDVNAGIIQGMRFVMSYPAQINNFAQKFAPTKKT